jgi:hypothetical protein
MSAGFSFLRKVWRGCLFLPYGGYLIPLTDAADALLAAASRLHDKVRLSPYGLIIDDHYFHSVKF